MKVLLLDFKSCACHYFFWKLRKCGSVALRFIDYEVSLTISRGGCYWDFSHASRKIPLNTAVLASAKQYFYSIVSLYPKLIVWLWQEPISLEKFVGYLFAKCRCLTQRVYAGAMRWCNWEILFRLIMLLFIVLFFRLRLWSEWLWGRKCTIERRFEIWVND